MMGGVDTKVPHLGPTVTESLATPLINSNQQSPKVVDPAAQKYYWRSTRPFFSPPPHTHKKVVWAQDYSVETPLKDRYTLIELQIL